MKVVVELAGVHHDVELKWDIVMMPDGHKATGWWLVSIDGTPRPRGKDVARIYQEALILADKAMKAAG